ncbi:MAG: hypothetical protein PVJ92_03150 [Candidatus Dependentiae bacterium]|jgi:hypothetical protein
MKKIALYALLFSLPLNAGGTKNEGDDVDAPSYMQLDPDQGIYNGTVYDGQTRVNVTKLSFGGRTEVDNIRKESDNSSNRVKMADITALEMIDPLHESRRYPHKEYSLMRVTMNNGSTEELLFPRHLVLCADSANSQIEKVWFLRAIDGVRFHHRSAKQEGKQVAHHIPVNEVDPVAELSEDDAAHAAQLLEELLQ